MNKKKYRVYKPNNKPCFDCGGNVSHKPLGGSSIAPQNMDTDGIVDARKNLMLNFIKANDYGAMLSDELNMVQGQMDQYLNAGGSVYNPNLFNQQLYVDKIKDTQKQLKNDWQAFSNTFQNTMDNKYQDYLQQNRWNTAPIEKVQPIQPGVGFAEKAYPVENPMDRLQMPAFLYGGDFQLPLYQTAGNVDGLTPEQEMKILKQRRKFRADAPNTAPSVNNYELTPEEEMQMLKQRRAFQTGSPLLPAHSTPGGVGTPLSAHTISGGVGEPLSAHQQEKRPDLNFKEYADYFLTNEIPKSYIERLVQWQLEKKGKPEKKVDGSQDFPTISLDDPTVTVEDPTATLETVVTTKSDDDVKTNPSAQTVDASDTKEEVETKRRGNIEDDTAKEEGDTTKKTESIDVYNDVYGRGYGNRKIKARGYTIDPETGKKERFRFKNKPGDGSGFGFFGSRGYPRKVKQTFNIYGQPQVVNVPETYDKAEVSDFDMNTFDWWNPVKGAMHPTPPMAPGMGVLKQIPSPYRADFDPYAEGIDPYAVPPQSQVTVHDPQDMALLDQLDVDNARLARKDIRKSRRDANKAERQEKRKQRRAYWDSKHFQGGGGTGDTFVDDEGVLRVNKEAFGNPNDLLGRMKVKDKAVGQGDWWTDLIEPGANLFASAIETGRVQQPNTFAHRMFTTNTQQDRGKHTMNQGYFDPYNMVPVQFPGYDTGQWGSPDVFAQQGGDVQYLDESEIAAILKAGGTIEYL